MSNKQMYNPKDIYFGNLTYNTYTEGYYYCSPEPYQKIIAENGEVLYQHVDLKPRSALREFYEGINDGLSVQYLIPITKLMPKNKQNTPISRKLMNWYLFKYIVRFNKYNKTIQNIDEISEDKQKVIK